jgi:hypothetical protein
MTNFQGKWLTTFGPMDLSQSGDRVTGQYVCMGTPCGIQGRVAGQRLQFTYTEPTVRGEGWFELAENGRSFRGEWHAENDTIWRPWVGASAGFDGVWQTDFGRMRLVEEGEDGRVHGLYELGEGSSIEGKRDGPRLTFTYREPNVSGEGRFLLADDALSFQGEWRPSGAGTWQPWHGVRVRPGPATWLVVLEVPWHAIGADRDYSFGAMLREFFSRSNHIQVRQRFFTNEDSLSRCLRELSLIPEPIVLLIATHAQANGIHLGGKTIGADLFVDGLSLIPDLRLLHFSACLLMQDAEVFESWRTLSQEQGCPISGYASSVDWAASAILEFTYLELILSRGLPPGEAANQMHQLLTFAGDSGPGDAIFPAARFRIVEGGSGRP